MVVTRRAHMKYNTQALLLARHDHTVVIDKLASGRTWMNYLPLTPTFFTENENIVSNIIDELQVQIVMSIRSLL